MKAIELINSFQNGTKNDAPNDLELRSEVNKRQGRMMKQIFDHFFTHRVDEALSFIIKLNQNDQPIMPQAIIEVRFFKWTQLIHSTSEAMR